MTLKPFSGTPLAVLNGGDCCDSDCGCEPGCC